MWLLLLLNLLAIVANILFGSVSIPTDELFDPRWHFIVFESRLPAAITAALTGASLGVSGLLLQSYFRNPLAGPSILGITSGANLMVAIVTLAGGSAASFGALSIGFSTSLVFAALLGAFSVLALLLFLGRFVRHHVTLLIVGILLSYLTSAAITLMGYYATANGVQNLMLWGMGNFNGVGLTGLWLFIPLTCLGLLASALLIKSLNGWMLGEISARNLGINISRTRLLLLLITGLLSAVTTAWCGPIAFVGLAMPHVARLICRTDDHRLLLPASLLCGSLCCSLCLLISTLPDGGTVLPINALTPVFGVPVILYILLSKK